MLAFHFLYRGELSHRTQKLMTIPQYFRMGAGEYFRSVPQLYCNTLVSIPSIGRRSVTVPSLSCSRIYQTPHILIESSTARISQCRVRLACEGLTPSHRADVLAIEMIPYQLLASSRARRHGTVPELPYSIPCQWAFRDFKELLRLHLACCLMTILAQRTLFD